MNVKCQLDPESRGTTLVMASGLLDAVGATEMWEAVSPHITPTATKMLVDMSGIHRMTSAGITTLIRLMTRVKQAGGTLCLFGCQSAVRKVFRIVGLEALLNVCDTADEARRLLQ